VRSRSDRSAEPGFQRAGPANHGGYNRRIVLCTAKRAALSNGLQEGVRLDAMLVQL
jgi:hypothetical protein